MASRGKAEKRRRRTGGAEARSLLGSLGQLYSLPPKIRNPFALAAVALVVSVPLAVFDGRQVAITSLVISVLLVALGLMLQPKGTVDRWLSRNVRYTSVVPTGLPSAAPGAASSLEKVYFLHLHHREGGGAFAYRGRFKVEYFLDLMEASTVKSHLEVTKGELARHIRSCINTGDFGCVVGPKYGNGLLISAVAQELGLAVVLVKEEPLFNRWLEGVLPSNKKAILVDDVSAAGEILVRCLLRAREDGIQIDRCFVLVDRVEGDAIHKLSEAGVTLQPLRRYADKDFVELDGRMRRGGA